VRIAWASNQFGDQWPVDDVGDPEIGPQELGSRGKYGVAVHPHEGRVDQSGRLRQQPDQGVRTTGHHSGIGIASEQRTGAILGARAVEIDDRHPLDTGSEERVTDGRAGSARTQ
jgi:hypothetical protein